MELHEFANEMSEILFGYREAKEEEMLDRVKSLVEMKVNARVAKNGEKIRKLISELQEVVEEENSLLEACLFAREACRENLVMASVKNEAVLLEAFKKCDAALSEL